MDLKTDIDLTVTYCYNGDIMKTQDRTTSALEIDRGATSLANRYFFSYFYFGA
jgi:hypothetical protein